MYNEILLTLSKEEYIDYLVCVMGWDEDEATHYADLIS